MGVRIGLYKRNTDEERNGKNEIFLDQLRDLTSY